MEHTDLTHINDLLNSESEIREKIKEQVNEFDKRTRITLGLLNKIHSTPTTNMPALLDSIRPHIESCRGTTQAIADLISPQQFWRYKEMWQNSLRNIVFAALLVEYLSNRRLASLAEVSAKLGIDPSWKNRFTLAVEDYLHGLISVVNELSRLAVNAVTLGDYEEPLKISTFVKDIFAGFAMLNLKNDTLRRRYDSLKYDIKKIEEVVYDVSLRKLTSPVRDDNIPKDK